MARPAGFAREEVLEKAMQAFWDRGYCATSMAQLVAATELNPGSLYAAFQSKRGLFLAALDHYGERSAERIEHALRTAESPLQGIRSYFRQLAAYVADPQAERGCFLVNSVLELGRRDAAIGASAKRHFDVIEAKFRNALTGAQTAGELAPDKDPRALAALLMSSIWGLRVLGATAPDAERARGVVRQLLQLLD